MKKQKDRYLINRVMYKNIKKYDHQQMEEFLTDVYKNGRESVPGIELEDVKTALRGTKGIGPVVWQRITERLADLFRKEEP